MTFISTSMTWSKPPRRSGHTDPILRPAYIRFCSTHCYNLVIQSHGGVRSLICFIIIIIIIFFWKKVQSVFHMHSRTVALLCFSYFNKSACFNVAALLYTCSFGQSQTVLSDRGKVQLLLHLHRLSLKVIIQSKF